MATEAGDVIAAKDKDNQGKQPPAQQRLGA
jgi:hypothetical protein